MQAPLSPRLPARGGVKRHIAEADRSGAASAPILVQHGKAVRIGDYHVLGKLHVYGLEHGKHPVGKLLVPLGAVCLAQYVAVPYNRAVRPAGGSLRIRRGAI